MDVMERAAEEDNRERLRAFDAAVAHRDAIHRLADELKLAFTVDELGRVVAEMNRVETRTKHGFARIPPGCRRATTSARPNWQTPLPSPDRRPYGRIS